MQELTKAEELLLLTVLRLKNNAYGVAIRQNIKAVTGKTVPYGTLYFLLDKLTVKGHVNKTLGDPTPERGGRRKTFYTLTQQGLQALKNAFDQQSRTWTDFATMNLHKGFGG